MSQLGINIIQYVIVILLVYLDRFSIWGSGNLRYLLMLGTLFALPKLNTLSGMEIEVNKSFGQIEFNDTNPLYKKGFYRKKAGGKIFADLKGHFYCQISLMLASLVGIVYSCLLYMGYINRIQTLENVLFIVYLIVLCIRFIFDCTYFYIYTSSFRYSENERGIWTPFAFMTRKHGWKKYTKICRNLNDDNIMESMDSVKENCISMGYRNVVSYEFGHGEDAFFFEKNDEKEKKIFLLFHIKEYRDENVDTYNRVFEDFWNRFIKEEKIRSVSLISLFYIDEWTADFGKRFDRIMSVDQKKGRYRLPAFVVQEECPRLYVLCNYSYFRGNQKHKKMKQELLKIMNYY